MSILSLRQVAIAAVVATSSVPAMAQVSLSAIAGEYDLASSTTVPASNWGFSKAHVSVRMVDDRHALILHSCQWKRSPKEACWDWFYAQQREGGIYLQDDNTDTVRFYFDPASRKLTMIWRGLDAKASVRHDVYAPATAPLTDTALLRRQKTALSSAEHKETLRTRGPVAKRSYQQHRIELQKNP
ncbi:hypothetical protein [Massilia sp. YMA4]|uniref:hypothetical protein n=1 Tax=Massilia sp. YMA4 TaxID=1593482 RepID=UPI001583B92C|nr:hypothetical protein [Massilia sp. YMA4]